VIDGVLKLLGTFPGSAEKEEIEDRFREVEELIVELVKLEEDE